VSLITEFCRTCSGHSEVSSASERSWCLHVQAPGCISITAHPETVESKPPGAVHTELCQSMNFTGSEVIVAVVMKIAVSWDVTPCNVVLEEVKLLLAGCLLSLLFDPEGRGSMSLRNYGELVPYFMLRLTHTSGPGQITFHVRMYICTSPSVGLSVAPTRRRKKLRRQNVGPPLQVVITKRGESQLLVEREPQENSYFRCYMHGFEPKPTSFPIIASIRKTISSSPMPRGGSSPGGKAPGA
jgi:hypothetical protein